MCEFWNTNLTYVATCILLMLFVYIQLQVIFLDLFSPPITKTHKIEWSQSPTVLKLYLKSQPELLP